MGRIMFNLLDYIIFALIILVMIRGWRLGLVKSLSGLVLFAASVVLAIWYAPSLSAYLEERWELQEILREWLMQHFPVSAPLADLSRLGIEAGVPYANNAANIAEHVLIALSFIIILLLVNVGGSLILFILYKIIFPEVLKDLDRVLGAIFHAAKLLLVLTVLLGIINEQLFLLQANGLWFGQELADLTDQSACGSFLISVYYQLKALVY